MISCRSLKFKLLLITVTVGSGILFSNCERKKENEIKSAPKVLSAAAKKAAKKKWEASPDGIMFKKWEASPAGKKVYAGEAKIHKSIKNFTPMEGIITSLSLPSGARLGFGIMVRIQDENYILNFGLEKPNDKQFQQLHTLKVNDTIYIQSKSVMHAPKYSYPIISGDAIVKDGKTIYKRVWRKDGC